MTAYNNIDRNLENLKASIQRVSEAKKKLEEVAKRHNEPELIISEYGDNSSIQLCLINLINEVSEIKARLDVLENSNG
jgi:hypothetical protein